ncbi:hypothetical protein PYW08_015609 [Mythimna loreyi]|uniref:Uncharacterized protein n=1 Tax=Mythimna loreyi TaxID=667449 RepID=A0ACC2QYD0_9NEOP|nr:hypothetical protein PYW08_015609 [Mythimna loreyi]
MNTFYLIVFFIVIQNVAAVSGDRVRIRVQQGWLEGEILDLITGDGQYNSFKGIPYAQPPNGTRRFKAPLPALGWEGVRNATEHGTICPQVNLFTNEFNSGNEDCLFLNVYSTNLTPKTLLPVLVFIHGGGYKSGSGNVDSYGPDFILRKDMVVVTFNYRLDALGFLSLGTKEVPGNAGLKDQVEALKWVQRNIKNFGGDADRVTIMGQSAGGASVALHIASPMSQGLFHRAIAMSGSPFCDWSLAFHPERRAFVLGKKLGFETEDPDELLEFLQSVPSDELVDTSPNILSFEEYTRNVYGLQGEKYNISGAAHIDDLLYLFDPKAMKLVSDRNSTEFQLIDQVTTIFTDFAIHGNPTYSPAFNMTWPLFDKKTLQFVDIGNGNLTVFSMDADGSFNFWEQLYGSLGTYRVIKHVPVNGIRVRVEQGWLEGEILNLSTGEGQYYSFKGIPYAQPPVGTLRFKAPRPPFSWSGVRSAKQHGSMCPQVDILTNKRMPGNEDCLFLNLYSPKVIPRRPLPVVVYIHGGAYKSGSGNVDYYGPDYILRKGMIVVTFNYRLDALGFICLGTEEVPGNAGLKDQVAALRWVQKNVKYFGGDSNRVTIMGQSAGSASVALHISSPMSKGLFHRAIALSGSPTCDWGLAFHPVRRAFVLGKKLGFETKDPQKLLEFLQSVPSEKLINTSPNILSFEEYTYNLIKMYQFVPVVEKYNGSDNFLTYQIFQKPTYMNKVDLMFGHTNEELASFLDVLASELIERYNKYPELFVPRKILNHVGPNLVLQSSDIIRKKYLGNKSVNLNSIKEFTRYANDATFVYDILRYFIRLPHIRNTIRHAYQFSITSKRNVYGKQGEKYGIFGAGHMDELTYLFDPKALKLVSNRNSIEFKLINKVTTIFTDFAKYGDPFYSFAVDFPWPMFNNCTKQYVDLSNDEADILATVLSVNDNDNFYFWEQLYSSLRRCTSNYFYDLGVNKPSHCFDHFDF